MYGYQYFNAFLRKGCLLVSSHCCLLKSIYLKWTKMMVRIWAIYCSVETRSGHNLLTYHIYFHSNIYIPLCFHTKWDSTFHIPPWSKNKLQITLLNKGLFSYRISKNMAKLLPGSLPPTWHQPAGGTWPGKSLAIWECFRCLALHAD